MRINTLLTTALLTFSVSASAETLRIGTSADYPPWESVDSAGEIVGFDRDIGDEVCARIGAECVWVNQNFDGLLPGLAIGKFDLVLAALSINAEREKNVDFSIAYADSPSSFIISSSNTVESDIDTTKLLAFLDGKKVGVQSGTTQEQVVINHIPSAQVRVYERPEQILTDIKAKRIDAGFTQRSAWDGLVGENPTDFKYVGPLLKGGDFSELGRGQGIVIRKGNAELKARVDEALKAMMEDGTIVRLSNATFGYDLSAQ
ncbi:transporter substrate-binding domain-containing protein [Marinomonas sp. 2405UD66-6]|uniref:transporter substrate-binding domain-containing protein n=1 Tax=Marinomonas sp. 2405UD66-6 TaxID=3391834 RepID=UPI0039C9B260